MQCEHSQFDSAERPEPLSRAIQSIAAARRYIRTWYLAYLLLGIVTAGLLPILLPLTVEAFSHRLSTVAYVMGAYNLGLLASPLWGMLAEHIKAYRKLFLGSFLLATTGILGMLLLRHLPAWLASAFALGAGSGGGATLATLFIVDFAEKAEWEMRLGWLQSFNASGQVIGLILAAALSGTDSAIALWLCVAVLMLALAIGCISLPFSDQARVAEATDQQLQSSRQVLVGLSKLNGPSGSELGFHAWNLAKLRGLSKFCRVPFGRFLLSWSVLAFAVAAFFAYFPLMLSDSYSLSAHTTAMIYAATSAIAIGLYIFSSHLTVRYGANRVYHAGLALRIFGFGLLLVPFLTSIASRSSFGAVGFALIVITWPLLSVSGTDLAARLTHFSEGAALGLQNASVALATVAGIVLTGPLVTRWGYGVIPSTALAGLAASLWIDSSI